MRPALKNQAQRYPARGCNVRRLDHFNCLAVDVRANREFFERALGFRLTERIVLDSGEEAGMWLTATNKSYDFAYTKEAHGVAGRFHHVTFALDSREEILRAAMTEFADHGFGGARIEAIAERAGVNKKLIYYYYAAKDELFLAVLEQSYADIRAAEHELHLETSDPIEAIRSLVGFTWRHYLAHPEFLALLNSENMHRAGHLKRSARIRQMNSPLIEVLAGVLKRGEESGELRSGIDAMQLYISIAGLAYFYLSNKHTLGAIFAFIASSNSFAFCQGLPGFTPITWMLATLRKMFQSESLVLSEPSVS